MIDIGFTSVATERGEKRERERERGRERGSDDDDDDYDGGKNAVESQISGFKCEIRISHAEIASFQA